LATDGQADIYSEAIGSFNFFAAFCFALDCAALCILRFSLPFQFRGKSKKTADPF
jgi:hypothetical protein